MSSPRSLLLSSGVSVLKQVAKILGVSNIPKYKSGDKEKLVDAIIDKIRALKAGEERISDTPHDMEHCREPKTKGGFSVDELIKIALKLGIDPNKLSKKELCQEILRKKNEEGIIFSNRPLSRSAMRSRSAIPTRIPSSLQNCKDSKTRGGFTVEELRRLAREHDVDVHGLTKKDMCEQLMKKIKGKEPELDVFEKPVEKPRDEVFDIEKLEKELAGPSMVSRSRSRSAIPRRIPSSLDHCNEPKSKGGFAVDELRSLAREHGIDVRGLAKKDICKQLMKKLKGKEPELDVYERPVGPSRSHSVVSRRTPTSLDNCNDPKSRGGFAVDELRSLAREHGVDVRGLTKKDMCKQLMEKLSDKMKPDVYSAKTEPTYEEKVRKYFSDLSVDQLKDLMNRVGIVNNRPTKKDDIVDYLCALKRNSCDHERECKIGYGCDMSNYEKMKKGLCVSNSTIGSRMMGSSTMSYIKLGDKTFYGNKESLKKLREKYDESRKRIDVPVLEEDESREKIPELFKTRMRTEPPEVEKPIELMHDRESEWMKELYDKKEAGKEFMEKLEREIEILEKFVAPSRKGPFLEEMEEFGKQVKPLREEPVFEEMERRELEREESKKEELMKKLEREVEREESKKEELMEKLEREESKKEELMEKLEREVEKEKEREVEREDISDVLKRIKSKGEVRDIEHLADVQKKVLKCLGLASE